jgi:hypothetical protein
MRDLGADAEQPLRRAFVEAKPGVEDERRKWLLRALLAVAPARGRELALETVRGFDFPVNPRIRFFAAQLMLEHDKVALGNLLGDILDYESVNGVQGQRLPPEQLKRYSASSLAGQRSPLFHNFVDLYVACGIPNADGKLIGVASRPDQDLVTVQKCVKHLGDLESQRAVPLIVRLFERPPEMQANPIFQNHCLDALAKIQGANVCQFLKDTLRRQDSELVQNKLKDLIKQHCSGE